MCGWGIPGAAGGGCWPCFRAAFAVGAQTTTLAVRALSQEPSHHLFGSANSCWVHLSLRMMYLHSRRKGHSRLLLQKSLAPQYDCQLQGTSNLSHAAALRVGVCTQPTWCGSHPPRVDFSFFPKKEAAHVWAQSPPPMLAINNAVSSTGWCSIMFI